MNEIPNMNGLAVRRCGTGKKGQPTTISIALPRELWREIEGGCCCAYCSPDPKKSGGPAYWDTMNIAIESPPPHRADATWTVHWPAINGGKKQRDEE